MATSDEETVRERALLVYALEYPTSNVIASDEPAGLLACERAGFVDGYLRASRDTLSAVLDELRAERDRQSPLSNGDVLNDAIARIEKLKPAGGQ